MDKVFSVEKLQKLALAIRKDVIISLAEAGSGHLGGSLSLADIFAILYFHVMNHKPQEPMWEYRDRLILSIGHVAPVLYSTLAHAGYFPKEELLGLRQLGSRLQGHPSKEHGLPGIEVSSGSLGQGLSISVGIALASRYDKKNINIYSIHGDGELQEGSIWEAAMSAAFYNLDNITAIIDRNRKQIDGDTESVMAIEPLKDKWEAFGWNCVVCNGHDIKELISVFSKTKNKKGKPKVIIANTIMSKGISSIQDKHEWHGKIPTHKQVSQFLKELDKMYYETE
jgi:transketolase